MKNFPLFLLLFFYIFNPTNTEAFEIKYGNDVKVESESIFEENLYLLGVNTSFDNFIPSL